MYVCNADAIIINRLLPFVFYTHMPTCAHYTDIYLSFMALLIVFSPRVKLFTAESYT